MTKASNIYQALQAFAESIKTKMTQLTSGEPEEQVRAPFENLMRDMAEILDRAVVCTGETPLPNRLGRPDYAIHIGKLLAGYVELKAPGTGADVKRFRGHNREQWKRFQAIPNIIYTDGNEWALYRTGEIVGKIVCLSGDITEAGRKAATADDASALEAMLRDFLAWDPIIPMHNGKIALKGFAEMLAPLCRMLRDNVTEALEHKNSPLVKLADEWRQLLFPDAGDAQFADAYAQTVTFALLLGRSEGADPLTLDSAEKELESKHSLLSRALEILTDPNARTEIQASLDLLVRVIAEVPPETLTGSEDPWLYFYEDFLSVYDPQLRKKTGAYYTPVEVVRAQVRLIDDLLVNRLGKPMGFAEPDVVTLDPATGTGTYLLGVIEHALHRVEKEQGKGAVPGQATALANNLYGFELMVGPYAVTELRVSQALRDRGADLPVEGSQIFLTDTLESPHTEPPKLPLYLKPISDQHKRALKVKSKVPVIVCLGNPPYDRHPAAKKGDRANTGGWVRWGDSEKGEDAILRNFIDPAVKAGHGKHIKNLYNLYVYFWRWAIWKVFEHETAKGQGVISYISASSYLDGDAFCGMREQMRRICDEIWILDLGGEGRGTRKSENVFAIQTPVAITVAVRSKKTKSGTEKSGIEKSGTGFQPVNHGLEGHATYHDREGHATSDSQADSVKIRHGAYLPHWTRDRAIYSVTFRLADSLPRSVVMGWIEERNGIIRNAKRHERPLSDDEKKRLDYLFSRKVDTYLDAGHGAAWMKKDKIAQIVADALNRFDGDRYTLIAWCIMPNHVHVVLQPLPGHELPTILHSWKSFTANKANRLLNRKGKFWQPEYYDHLIRDEDDLQHSIVYVLQNPKKAGLKNWKWVGGGTGSGTGRAKDRGTGRGTDRGTGRGTGFQPVDHGLEGHAKSGHDRSRGTNRGTGFQPVNHGLEGHATYHGQDGRATTKGGANSGAARVHYTRIDGTRHDKLSTLDNIRDFSKIEWQDCPDEWLAPFRPAGKGDYFGWPLLTDLMPWQHSGAQYKRTWPICCDQQILKKRWYALLNSKNKKTAFKETRDRKISSKCISLINQEKYEKPINAMKDIEKIPQIKRYAYRSFDRQWAFADSRLGDFIRPDLWRAHSDLQVYLASLLTKFLGSGPALTASSKIPDLDYFSGRGAKDVIPLYRKHNASDANILPGLLQLISKDIKKEVKPEEFVAYVYGILAQPAFTEKYRKELESRELRVPITKDKKLFDKVRAIGAKLLWLHTYGERYVPKGKQKGYIPRGKAKNTKPVPGDPDGYPESFTYNDETKTLHVGEGEFKPVTPEVFEFEVSGLKVVQSWLKYRMKKGAGKKSSPLDDIRPERWTSQFTTELLHLLWILEATIAIYPEQEKLLEKVVSGECFTAEELPEVPEKMRKPPKIRKSGGDLFDNTDE